MNPNQRAPSLWRHMMRRRSVPYALCAVGCVVSAVASNYLSDTAVAAADSQARAEFEADTDQMRRQIQAGLNSYIEVIRAGAVLLSTDNEINGSEFRQFVAGLRLPDRYPGLQGIGFVQCMRARDLNRFLRVLDLDGNRIRVWPPKPRPTYCPTLFFNPRTGANQGVLGFDVVTEPAFAVALARARDTGEPAASEKVDSAPVWDAADGGRVALFIPVYRSTRSLESREARRRALVGYVFGPLDPDRVLHSITASTQPSLAYEVHDGTGLLATTNPPSSSARFYSSDRVQFAGSDWQVRLRSLAAPDAVTPLAARQALVAGLALSLMLFLVSRAQVRAWETAARHQAVLQASTEALRESESQARAANVAKDEFLATVSHELRTPLNVVLGWVSMLRRDAVEQARVPHALEIIERNARQQAQLIDDLLDVSRIVMGHLRLDRHVVSLAPLVSTVVESLRPGADAKGIALRADAANDPCNMLGDADRLRQTIWNLVANAIKFTPSGGEVHVELMRHADRIRLTVHDTGVGIDAEFLPYVFERFKQADSSTTRMHSGVGLGLAIARHLVELHGGTIEARSAGAGHGATFIIELPGMFAETSSVTVAAVAGSATPTPVLAGVRVLVVDDDASTLELLTTALSTTGAHVISALSARDALDRVTADSPDIIVSDIAMPGEDGFWLIKRIRTLSGDRARTPAIALTALARREDRTRVLDAGYQLHVAKPVELTELQSHVAMLVAEHSGSSGPHPTAI